MQAPFQLFHLGHERPQHGDVQAVQAKLPGQRLLRRARVDLRVQLQLAQPLALEAQLAVDALRTQGALQQQAPVGEIDPAILLFQAQYAAAGVQGDLAIGAAGRQVELEVGIEFALPGEVLRQPTRQARQGKVAQAVVQIRLRQQTLFAATEAGRPGAPAVGAEVQLAVGQALQPGRGLQAPVLAAGLDLAASQAAAPVRTVELAVDGQQQVQHRPLEIELQLLAHPVAGTIGGERAEFVVAGGQAIGLELHAAALGGIQPGVQFQAGQAVIGLS
ncbi:hypothetical protein D9M71_490740 [compost metagenome]